MGYSSMSDSCDKFIYEFGMEASQYALSCAVEAIGEALSQ